MLDIFMALFVVAAFGCLIVDRDEVRARMARVYAEGRIGVTDYGPRLGVRWWRFGAGVMLGLACGTKWSGLYFIAFFGLMSVAFDVAARRRYGVRRPWLGAGLRDVGPALYALVVVPPGLPGHLLGVVRLGDRVDRHAVGNQLGFDGSFSFFPAALRSLWYYSGNVLEFHGGLTNSAGNHHPWESKPWTWPMGLRPMLYYFAEGDDVSGCGAASCVKAVMLIGTPPMWWLALPMLGWALWRTVVGRDWRYAAVLTGYAAGLLPWFVHLDRQMYFFYAVALAPFLAMGLALVCGEVIGRARASYERRRTGLLAVASVPGPGHRELRLAVADPDGRPDHPGDAADSSCGCQLAVTVTPRRPSPSPARTPNSFPDPEATSSTSLAGAHGLVQTDEIGHNRVEPLDAVCPTDTGVVDDLSRRFFPPRVRDLCIGRHAGAMGSDLVELVRAFDGAGAGLLTSAPATRQSDVMVRQVGADPSLRTTYNEYYGRLDYVATAVENAPVGRIHTGPN